MELGKSNSKYSCGHLQFPKGPTLKHRSLIRRSWLFSCPKFFGQVRLGSVAIVKSVLSSLNACLAQGSGSRGFGNHPLLIAKCYYFQFNINNLIIANIENIKNIQAIKMLPCIFFMLCRFTLFYIIALHNLQSSASRSGFSLPLSNWQEIFCLYRSLWLGLLLGAKVRSLYLGQITGMSYLLSSAILRLDLYQVIGRYQITVHQFIGDSHKYFPPSMG